MDEKTLAGSLFAVLRIRQVGPAQSGPDGHIEQQPHVLALWDGSTESGGTLPRTRKPIQSKFLLVEEFRGILDYLSRIGGTNLL